ncbi:glutathione S-transferase 1-like [Ornithodoros turicata]|uniref:glutathione S-transferase 1-like n=1 Tax=Ornithodoros turicata TaxID=34597 RepID=UPI0031392193
MILFRCCGFKSGQVRRRPKTPIVLYHAELSAPCRAVRMVMKLLSLPVELKTLDIIAGDHLKAEYVQMNPQHTVPTLVDEGFVLYESRAIMTYLVDKYAPDHDLYPQDLQKRAVINRLLFFDVGTLYPAAADYFMVQAGLQDAMDADTPFRRRSPRYAQQHKNKVKSALEFLYVSLGEKLFLTGNEITVADISIVSSLSLLDVVNYDHSEFPSVGAYYEKLKASLLCYDEVNSEGIRQFRTIANI